MKELLFNRKYKKLDCYEIGNIVQLLSVSHISWDTIKEKLENLVSYDTEMFNVLTGQYWVDLKKVDYLLLIFYDSKNHFFTTFRKDNKENRIKYHNSIFQKFVVRFV